MSSYVIPVFPAASRVPPRDALAARLAELTGRFAELSSELAALASAVGSVSGKADKAPPLAAGSLAALAADGNLADSGKSPSDFAPASGIAKSALDASVQASLHKADTAVQSSQLFNGNQIKPGLLPSFVDDVLEYPALSGFPESGETGKIYVAKDANRTYRWSGSRYVEIAASPVTSVNGRTGAVVLDIPDAVTVDPALSDGSTNPVQNRAVKAALDGKRGLADLAVYSAADEWGCTAGPASYRLLLVQRPSAGTALWASGADPSSSVMLVRYPNSWVLTPAGGDGHAMYDEDTGWDADTRNLEFDVDGVAWRLVYVDASPTGDSLAKVSQTPTAEQVGYINAVPGKADKVSGATNGHLASLDSSGNLVDSGANPSDFATPSDLPYALVTPGEWEFSGEGYDPNSDYTVEVSDSGGYGYTYSLEKDGVIVDNVLYQESGDSTSVFFADAAVTATKTGIHLLDRAANAVPVAGATTLTLPALVNAGKARDFLVRLTVSADSAVTFSAATGETITWDDAGSPTATYEAGTHLLRFTEVGLDNGSYIFHFTDLDDGGSIDPAVLNGKLEATSAAPAFDDSKTYSVGEHVTYNGVLYECSTAVTTAGAWTGFTNWTATDMTSPDATLDLMADGRLRLVSADGEVLWMQGYALASASSVTLSCDKVNFHAFAAAPAFDATASYAVNDVVTYDGVVYVFTAAHAAGAWTGSDATVYAVALAMPTAPSGKVGDFVLDVDNTANASASVTATLTGAGTAFDVFTPEGVNLSTDILTFAGGEQCELYFMMTAFGTAAKPAWKVVKQVVEKQEFGS